MLKLSHVHKLATKQGSKYGKCNSFKKDNELNKISVSANVDDD